MKQISLLMLLCSSLFLCCNSNKNPEKVQVSQNQEDTLKAKTKQQNTNNGDLVVQEIRADSLIVGAWKIVTIGGNPPQEERKDITAVFEKDGKFQRRLSLAYEPEIGTWSIDEISGIKALVLIFGTITETNQLIKLTKNELIFANRNILIKMKKNK